MNSSAASGFQILCPLLFLPGSCPAHKKPWISNHTSHGLYQGIFISDPPSNHPKSSNYFRIFLVLTWPSVSRNPHQMSNIATCIYTLLLNLWYGQYQYWNLFWMWGAAHLGGDPNTRESLLICFCWKRMVTFTKGIPKDNYLAISY